MRDKGWADSGVSRIDANDLYLSSILKHGLPLLQSNWRWQPPAEVPWESRDFARFAVMIGDSMKLFQESCAGSMH